MHFKDQYKGIKLNRIASNLYNPKVQIVWYASSIRFAERNNANEKMVKMMKSHDFDSILDIFQDCKPKTGWNQAYDGLKFVRTKGANCVICLID